MVPHQDLNPRPVNWKSDGLTGLSVGEEELTRNYIKLVVAAQMGQGIMPNTVRESRRINF